MLHRAGFAAFVEAPGGLSPAPEITLTALQFDFRDGGGLPFWLPSAGSKTVIVDGVLSIYRAALKVSPGALNRPTDTSNPR
jgi:hypothetical protein